MAPPASALTTGTPGVAAPITNEAASGSGGQTPTLTDEIVMSEEEQIRQAVEASGVVSTLSRQAFSSTEHRTHF